MRDGINDLASVRGIFPVAIKAAKLLKVDAELVPLWQEMLDKLAPYPTNATPQGHGRAATGRGTGVSRSASATTIAVGSDHDPRMMMVNVFDLVNTESKLTKSRRMADGDEHAGRPEGRPNGIGWTRTKARTAAERRRWRGSVAKRREWAAPSG